MSDSDMGTYIGFILGCMVLPFVVKYITEVIFKDPPRGRH